MCRSHFKLTSPSRTCGSHASAPLCLPHHQHRICCCHVRRDDRWEATSPGRWARRDDTLPDGPNSSHYLIANFNSNTIRASVDKHRLQQDECHYLHALPDCADPRCVRHAKGQPHKACEDCRRAQRDIQRTRLILGAMHLYVMEYLTAYLTCGLACSPSSSPHRSTLIHIFHSNNIVLFVAAIPRAHHRYTWCLMSECLHTFPGQFDARLLAPNLPFCAEN